MYRSMITVAATLAVSGFVHAQDAVQWKVEDGGNDHWYQAVASSEWITWVDSYAASEAAGGYLATVTSEEENQFIYVMIEPIADFWNGGQWDGPWIGGLQDVTAPDYSEPAGGWTWITGEVWNYTNWEPSQPDDNTAAGPEIYLRYWQRDTDTWNDQRNDSETHGHIIEWSADCNGDGIVDYGQILDGSYADDDQNGVLDLCETLLFLDDTQWRPSAATPIFLSSGTYRLAPQPNPGGIGDGLNAFFTGGGWDSWKWQVAIWDSDDDQTANRTFFFSTLNHPDHQTAFKAGLDFERSEDSTGYPSSSSYQFTVTDSGTYYFGVYDNDQTNNAGEVFANLIVISINDCNDNGVQDADDIANGTSQDCNGNSTPDECDVANGTSNDCNVNGIPDECEVLKDCNSNGIPDECESFDDCNSNNIPDECESLADCNNNGTPDVCETLADCDGDGTPDVCEILNGAIDANPADGVPDECQGLPVGACCVNGQCTGLTAAQCFELDGNFAGIDISCADANCPTSCPGDIDGDGQVGIVDILVVIDRWGFCP